MAVADCGDRGALAHGRRAQRAQNRQAVGIEMRCVPFVATRLAKGVAA